MEFVPLEKRALIRPVVIAAGIIGSIQGLLWTILALIVILYYYGCITRFGDSTYEKYIYHYFLDRDSENPDDFTLSPKDFNILMYFYLVLSFAWFILSLYILWAMLRQKWMYSPPILACWSGLTIAIAILDVTSVGLIAADYSKFQNLASSPSGSETTNISMTFIIVMSALARGYVLWIVNVVFGIILARFSYKMSKQKEPMRLSLIDGYGTSLHGLNLYEETDIGNGNVNNCFQPDDDIIFGDTCFNNDKTNRNSLGKGNPTFLHKYHTNLSPQNDRTAKIGKTNGGLRTPPMHVSPPNVPYPYEMKHNGTNLPRPRYCNPPLQNVERQNVNPNMPYIPEPDYTPPCSPKLLPKSVLRPKSNYIS